MPALLENVRVESFCTTISSRCLYVLSIFFFQAGVTTTFLNGKYISRVGNLTFMQCLQ